MKKFLVTRIAQGYDSDFDSTYLAIDHFIAEVERKEDIRKCFNLRPLKNKFLITDIADSDYFSRRPFKDRVLTADTLILKLPCMIPDF